VVAVALGRKREAWEMAIETRSLGGRQPLNEGRFGYVAAATGHPGEGMAVLKELQTGRVHGYSPALPIAWIYMGLGETQAGLEWLEAAVREAEPYLPSVAVSHLFGCVRQELRFQAILSQTGSEPAKPSRWSGRQGS
jgi:hypothetical protein